MKFSLPVIAALALASLVAACSHKPKETGSEAKSENEAKSGKATEPEPRVKHGTNGEVLLTLDEATQKRMGLQMVSLVATQLSPEIKAYGRVLDISPLAALVAELNTAEAASAASEAELQRLRTLAAQNNASERALQAAQAVAARDRAQVESAKLRLDTIWGTTLASRPDLPDLVRSISSLNAALVEINVPADESLKAAPSGARLFTLADPTRPIEARLVGPSPVVDPQLQGRGFLFLVSPNPERLTMGAAVTALLSLPGEPLSGVALPRPAVIRYNGVTWAYLQAGNELFERREVKLDSPLTGGAWFIREGVKTGDRVVTEGAQQMLSEELKGQSGE